MIDIIDVGGNSAAIKNMFKKIGVESKISNDKSDILRSDHLILPGVGNFDSIMKKIWDSDIYATILESVYDFKIPILGICIGMHVLMYVSEEGTKYNGFGMIEGDVVRFKNGEKKTHMGWNTLIDNKKNKLFENMPPEEKFYFIHSFHVRCDPKYVLAHTNYGYSFPSVVNNENIYGVQFHPEKSHKYGMILLKNFSEI